MDSLCESCRYNECDDINDECFCSLVLDEDEYVRLMQDKNRTCRYFIPAGNEYDIVKKQN